MEIYVVQPDDTIDSIADKYGVTVSRLIQDNGLDYPNKLVIGQTIVIAYPKQTYTVKDGDTLNSIAEMYHITIMQLLRNNPFLSDRQYIYPGEILVISYDTDRKIETNGIAYPYINRETLYKTLPYLTYISVFNYRMAEKGELIAYYDDEEIIRISKEFGTIPLMMASTVTLQGEPNIEIAYSILSNKDYQDRFIENVLSILKNKGYYGLNLIVYFMNTVNQEVYKNFLLKISSRLKQEGYLCFLSLNPSLENVEKTVFFERIDYTAIGEAVDGILFLKFVWGTNYGPPSPVSNINNIRALMEYVVTMVTPDKIIIGKPVISYDWQLPYIPGKSSASSLTVDSALNLARDTGTTIQFDEASQTPFFRYNQINIGPPSQHIVWSLDARSINALESVVKEYSLIGIGFWNVMVYYSQLWLLINSQYEIVKHL